MVQVNSDVAIGVHLSEYGSLKLTPELKGRKVKTEYGLAEIVRVITSQQWLHLRYEDGSIGWVRVGQFEFVD